MKHTTDANKEFLRTLRRACYAILEPGAENPVEFVRLPYHIDRARTAILERNELAGGVRGGPTAERGVTRAL